jgi:hypothetical protein
MGPADGVRELNDRVSALDSYQVQDYEIPDYLTVAQRALFGDIKAFIGVLRNVTSLGSHDETPIVLANDADEIISTCQLIRRIGARLPELTLAEAIACPQYWIATGTPSWVPPRNPTPATERFVPPGSASQLGNANPFGMGFYTSTGFLGLQGMWRIYLDFDQDSSLFPRPWHVWRLDPDVTARVCNIANAKDWERLVLNYPRPDGPLMYPEWKSIAGDWDAVHLTPKAIAAIQGIRLRAGRGLLAPSYWDTETTFWLRWVFNSAVHVETVNAA